MFFRLIKIGYWSVTFLLWGGKVRWASQCRNYSITDIIWKSFCFNKYRFQSMFTRFIINSFEWYQKFDFYCFITLIVKNRYDMVFKLLWTFAKKRQNLMFKNITWARPPDYWVKCRNFRTWHACLIDWHICPFGHGTFQWKKNSFLP